MIFGDLTGVLRKGGSNYGGKNENVCEERERAFFVYAKIRMFEDCWANCFTLLFCMGSKHKVKTENRCTRNEMQTPGGLRWFNGDKQ